MKTRPADIEFKSTDFYDKIFRMKKHALRQKTLAELRDARERSKI
jgi:hypothetical protein